MIFREKDINVTQNILDLELLLLRIALPKLLCMHVKMIPFKIIAEKASDGRVEN